MVRLLSFPTKTVTCNPCIGISLLYIEMKNSQLKFTFSVVMFSFYLTVTINFKFRLIKT